MKPLTAEEKLTLYEQRHQLLIKWLHKQADDRRNRKKPEPHPLDFSMDDDPNAYQNACSVVQGHNWALESSASAYEYVLEAIKNYDRELEAKLSPSNEYEI